MDISFDNLKVGSCCDGPFLAEIWKRSGYHALAKGIVTPEASNYIILFVTCSDPGSIQQYRADFKVGLLNWEGPRDHFGEDRMLHACDTCDEIHVFYRKDLRSGFVYQGQFKISASTLNEKTPSKFTLNRI